MGRIRTLKPDFFRSRSLAKVSLEARVTFQGLWCEADDHGRGVADPRIIKGVVWPLDDNVSAEDIGALLHELADSDHIVLYEIDGERFYEVIKWAKHQSAAYRRGVNVHPAPSVVQESATCTIEEPDGPDSPADQGEPVLHDESCKNVQAARPIVLEGKGREGNWEEEGRGSVAPDGAPTARGSRLPDSFELLPEMRAWAIDNTPGVSLSSQHDRFCDYWRAQAGARGRKVDWIATWRNWMRRASDDLPVNRARPSALGSLAALARAEDQ